MQLNSTSENPFDWNLLFTAPDGTTRLWWKVSKTNLTLSLIHIWWPRMSLEVNITKKLNGFTLHANFAARSTATAILGLSLIPI